MSKSQCFNRDGCFKLIHSFLIRYLLCLWSPQATLKQMPMGNLVLGYSTQIYGEHSAATDHAAFSTAEFALVSWEEMRTELAVVSLANSLWTACSESGSISMADTCCSSSCASLREVRVKFCCWSLCKRKLYIQRARVAPTAWNKGCIILK